MTNQIWIGHVTMRCVYVFVLTNYMIDSTIPWKNFGNFMNQIHALANSMGS